MVFTSTVFVAFLLVTFVAYWGTPSPVIRKTVLLASSLTFYAWWDYRFLALVFYVTLVAYASGRALDAWPIWRRQIVAASVTLQLAQLLFFKYTNFLVTAVGQIANQ